MNKPAEWRFEEKCTNEIVIYRGDAKAACIVNDEGDTTDLDRQHAKFIVSACNAWARTA